jgi:ubiquinone/menaquinone biosynthesis C-methylase UbiE
LSVPPQPARVWLGLVDSFFSLLYDRLAWAYDTVSWLASLGRWRRWQTTVLPYLPARGRILDLACGPGHLPVSLWGKGYDAIGLDTSPGMVRLAQGRIRRHGCTIPVLQGQAESLPFAPESMDAIAITFPTGFVYDAQVIEQAWRVLRSGGRLVVATQASFTGRGPLPRFMEWLYRITGQRGPAPDLARSLASCDFVAWSETASVDGTIVTLVVASKTLPSGQDSRTEGVASPLA